MTTDTVNSSQSLSISPPFVNPESLLFISRETEFYIDVIKALSRVLLGPFTTTVDPFRVIYIFSGTSTV